jgi:RNA polymerase sigma-70 factor (ECF subfamily)
MRSLFDYLRRSVLTPEAGGLTDGQLLERFLARREDAAFATLVQRHGPMVLAVARRLLGHVQDTEDVFQATFLVLVRKAATLSRRDLLGNWLYGVAYRTALHARVLRARRRARETQGDTMPDRAASPPERCPELLGLVDEALHRLPDKYRVPVVLCDLEGRSRKEVAGQLRIPEGTLSSRLATARHRLARHLARRGLVLSGEALAVGLASEADAALPPALAADVVQSARRLAAGDVVAVSPSVLTLMEGVLRTMLVNRIKVYVLGFLVVGLAGVV